VQGNGSLKRPGRAEPAAGSRPPLPDQRRRRRRQYQLRRSSGAYPTIRPRRRPDSTSHPV